MKKFKCPPSETVVLTHCKEGTDEPVYIITRKMGFPNQFCLYLRKGDGFEKTAKASNPLDLENKAKE